MNKMKGKITMGIYEELVARGLIAQVTNEPEIREMINSGKATFYIGFDCTADSLTAPARISIITPSASDARWSVLSTSARARLRW